MTKKFRLSDQLLNRIEGMECPTEKPTEDANKEWMELFKAFDNLVFLDGELKRDHLDDAILVLVNIGASGKEGTTLDALVTKVGLEEETVEEILEAVKERDEDDRFVVRFLVPA